MNGQIRCANFPACISFLRSSKKEGDRCDCCLNEGKETELIFLDSSPPYKGRFRSSGGMFACSYIRYNGS